MSKTQYSDAIIRNSVGQILLLHRSYNDDFMPGKWTLPGGHVDEGEEPSQAVIREVVEETGLNVTIVKQVLVKEKEDCIISYYEVTLTDPKEIPLITLDVEEHRGFEWVDIDEVANYDLVCDLNKYIDSEILNQFPIMVVEKIHSNNPFESLDNNFNLIEEAFNSDLISEEQFFKAKEQYIVAKKRECLELLKKAHELELITSDQYVLSLVKGGDPSHGGKLIKKIITEKSGKITTKWVDPHTGEVPEKIKKEKVEPTEKWYDKYKSHKLNCYPIGIEQSEVQSNEAGDIDSHWILKWKDPKSGKMKNAYSKEFMDRNASEKWNRMKNVSGQQIASIKGQSKASFQNQGETDQIREAAAIVNIIANTGLRRGDKVAFKATGNRGVTSLSPKNITIEGSKIKFDFIGKSYQQNVAEINDQQLATFLQEKIKQREGEEFLFDTTDSAVDSVFEKVGGKGLKIKDMRTYVAGDVARKVLFEDNTTPPPVPSGLSKSQIQKLIDDKLQRCYVEVSQKLNNTPTMAKNSYIHPNIVDFWIKKLDLDFEIKKSSFFGKIGEAVIKMFKRKISDYTMDDILAAYPKDIIQETDCINEEDEEYCDTFNEHSFVSNELEKSEVDELEKGGKPAFIGEIRSFAGRRHIKTTEGWKFYGEGTGAKAKSHEKGTPVKKVETHTPTHRSVYSYRDLTSKRTSIGGSGGASLVEDKDGKKLVLKEQVGEKNTPDHLKQEKLSDDIYAAMGFETAKGNISLVDGKTYKITEYLNEAKELSVLSGLTAFEDVCKEIQKGFVLDCLLLNWDVVGAGLDNIMVDKDLKPIRIDNGGSLFYRAKAGFKADSSLTAAVTEIDVMRSSKNPSSQKVFGSITDADIKSQALEIVSKKDLILKKVDNTSLGIARIEQVKKLLGSRIDWLEQKYGDKATIEPIVAKEAIPEKAKHEYSSDVTNKYFSDWDSLKLEANKEAKVAIKKQIMEIEKHHEDRYVQYAKNRGISVEKYKSLLQEKVESLIKGSNFFRATDIKVLDNVLNIDKRFKSQFETGTSHGALSPSSRASTEHIYFGFKKGADLDKEKRAIYGYFTDNDNGVINKTGEIPPPSSVSSYGAVTVKINREAAMRKATLCFKDSLNSSYDIACTPACKPHFTSMEMYPDPLLTESISSRSSSYVEAQYHNQLTADDISSIHISPFSKSHEPDYELINKTYDIVRKSHIPVKVFGKK